MTSKFLPNFTIPLRPFQGTLGVAPPDGYFPPLSPGVTNAVPQGTANMINFYQNLVMAGGFLYVINFGAGAISVDEGVR